MTKSEKIRKHPRYVAFLAAEPGSWQRLRLAAVIAKETRTSADDVRNSLRSNTSKRGRKPLPRCSRCGVSREAEGALLWIVQNSDDPDAVAKAGDGLGREADRKTDDRRFMSKID